MLENITKNLRGLVAEDDSFSLGRLGFWVAFLPAIHIWLLGDDIKMYHFYTLVIFLAYNFSKKIPLFIKLIQAWKSNKEVKEAV